jgi:hypothetical protein
VRGDPDGATHELGSTAPAADGRYSITTPAVEGARYRVRTPRGDSPEIAPDITARVSVHLTVRHEGRRLRVEAHSTPPAAGMIATLQLYDRWHYRWRARKSRPLAADGMAFFSLPGATRSYARVVLRRAKGERTVTRSPVVRTRDGKPARDPDLIRPGYGGHGGGHGDGGTGGDWSAGGGWAPGGDTGGGAHDGH